MTRALVVVAVSLLAVLLWTLTTRIDSGPTAVVEHVDAPAPSPHATVTAPEGTATEVVSPGTQGVEGEILANSTPTTELQPPNLESVPTNPSLGKWDRLAACESSTRWDLAPDRYGQSGGLQILDRTWEAFGGLQFAAAPYLASAAQQIVVSERILAAQGVHAWPVCGPKVGLG